MTKENAQRHVRPDETRDKPRPVLIEGEDYYLEAGLMVFTAHFLRRRGYCCENGCRHCPYDKAPVQRPEES